MPDQEWKQALVDYVNVINEADLLGDAGALRRVPDPLHRARLAQRAEALAQRSHLVRFRPIRSEIKARLLRSSERAAEAAVELQLHIIRSYEQDGHPWREERLERERIRLIRTGKGWRIDGIEPVGGESRPVPMTETDTRVAGEYGWPGRPVLPSIPLIKASASASRKSKVYAAPGTSGSWDDWSERAAAYRREEAVAYAELWWDRPNPAFEHFEVNCTNYVSQCLFAGGAPMNYTGRRESGWWYKGFVNGKEQWSFSWAVANSLQHYLSFPRSFGLRAQAVESPRQLMLGDVICYDWDGNGRYQHNTVVTAFTPDGMPLVNANTVSSRRRYWDYRDSYAWTERTRYRFFHISEEF
ncbi:amidase domain-containing protein [Cohnella laeviribosi]|uniref:amidase domain-containing protein n=1 Tax=Cohnella laeviribosi TaxID=380174 RepID=UPI000367693B|nr:amidase domain-containing protein [Cohnella laeviribosi]